MRTTCKGLLCNRGALQGEKSPPVPASTGSHATYPAGMSISADSDLFKRKVPQTGVGGEGEKEVKSPEE